MHQRIFTHITTVFCLIAFIGFSAVSIVAAQTKPTGITMSPVNYIGNYRNGEVVNTSFMLRNDTTTQLTLELSVAEIIDGEIVSDSDLADTWTHLDKDTVSLLPSEETEVRVTITIPDAAAPGAYYPAIFVRSVDADTLNTTGTVVDSQLTFQMGINVTATLPVTSVQVTKLSTAGLVFTPSTTISYEITNPLTLFVRPVAYLQVLTPSGQQIFTHTINENLRTLRPGEKLTGEVTVDLPLSLNNLGQYRVELLVLDQQFSTADILKTSFMVIPYWLILGGATLGGMAFVALQRSRFNRRHG